MLLDLNSSLHKYAQRPAAECAEEALRLWRRASVRRQDRIYLSNDALVQCLINILELR
jgi:hypothetical protein